MKGVYIIKSIIFSDRIYVGSGNVIKRKYNHFFLLRSNKHHSKKLQNHYNKYGENDLMFEVIKEYKDITKNALLECEQECFYRFRYKDSMLPYFNVAPKAGSNAGIIFTDDHKKKISASNKGRKWTAESRQKLSISKKGVKLKNPRAPRSIYSIIKQSKSMMGKTPWNKGKKGVMPPPWNKGKKGVMPIPWSKGKKLNKAPSTAFKKGHAPWNKNKNYPLKWKGLRDVLQFDMNGVFIKSWASAEMAANELNISVHYIRRRCHGYCRKTIKDIFIFKYKDTEIV